MALSSVPEVVLNSFSTVIIPGDVSKAAFNESAKLTESKCSGIKLSLY